MSKKILLILTIIILLICISLYIFFNNTYSLKRTQNLIEKNNNINNYCITENFYKNGNQIGYTKFYRKDGNIYVDQNDDIQGKAETFYDIDTNKKIIILHNNKSITNVKDNNNNLENPIITEFKESADNGIYKYYGKEKLDFSKCIKVGFSIDNQIKYYYIDLKTNNIVKTEIYENSDEKLVTIYNYEYNSVENNEILKFNIDNYPDYTYNNW